MVLGSVFLALVLCITVAVALLYSYGRNLQAPVWLRDMAVEQFSAAIPGADVSFENLTLEIEQDWHPRILLERVVIAPDNGAPPIEFSEAETSLSYRRILQ